MMNLRCIKVDLFFIIMMIPINNYFSSIVSWIHRPLALMLMIASAMKLENAIKYCAIGYCITMGLLMYYKNLNVIQHKNR